MSHQPHNSNGNGKNKTNEYKKFRNHRSNHNKNNYRSSHHYIQNYTPTLQNLLIWSNPNSCWNNLQYNYNRNYDKSRYSRKPVSSERICDINVTSLSETETGPVEVVISNENDSIENWDDECNRLDENPEKQISTISNNCESVHIEQTIKIESVFSNDNENSTVIESPQKNMPSISVVPNSLLVDPKFASELIFGSDADITNTLLKIFEDPEEISKKLVNKVVAMDKTNIWHVINNPMSKFDTALKMHARKKLREEIRRQLRNINFDSNEICPGNNFEPDDYIDTENIPQEVLDQIRSTTGYDFTADSDGFPLLQDQFTNGTEIRLEDTMCLENENCKNLLHTQVENVIQPDIIKSQIQNNIGDKFSNERPNEAPNPPNIQLIENENNTSSETVQDKPSNNINYLQERFVQSFKNLILPNIPEEQRLSYEKKGEKSLNDALSKIYDMCMDKLNKKSTTDTGYVQDYNLKSSNNEEALNFLIRSIKELFKQKNIENVEQNIEPSPNIEPITSTSNIKEPRSSNDQKTTKRCNTPIENPTTGTKNDKNRLSDKSKPIQNKSTEKSTPKREKKSTEKSATTEKADTSKFKSNKNNRKPPWEVGEKNQNRNRGRYYHNYDRRNYSKKRNTSWDNREYNSGNIDKNLNEPISERSHNVRVNDAIVTHNYHNRKFTRMLLSDRTNSTRYSGSRCYEMDTRTTNSTPRNDKTLSGSRDQRASSNNPKTNPVINDIDQVPVSNNLRSWRSPGEKKYLQEDSNAIQMENRSNTEKKSDNQLSKEISRHEEVKKKNDHQPSKSMPKKISSDKEEEKKNDHQSSKEVFRSKEEEKKTDSLPTKLMPKEMPRGREEKSRYNQGPSSVISKTKENEHQSMKLVTNKKSKESQTDIQPSKFISNDEQEGKTIDAQHSVVNLCSDDDLQLLESDIPKICVENADIVSEKSTVNPNAIQKDPIPINIGIDKSVNLNENTSPHEEFINININDSYKILSLIEQNKVNKSVLTDLKTIDLKLMELHKKKIEVEKNLLQLQREKMEIDLSTMQLQNDRFVLISSTLANPGVYFPTKSTIPLIEPNIIDTEDKKPTKRKRNIKPKTTSNFSEKLKNRKKRCQRDILIEDTANALCNNAAERCEMIRASSSSSLSPEKLDDIFTVKGKRTRKSQKESEKIINKKCKESLVPVFVVSETSDDCKSLSSIDDGIDDTEYNEPIGSISIGQVKGFRLPIVQIHTVDNYIIAASEDGNIYKYDLSNRDLSGTFSKHTESITGISIENNNSIYSTSLDGYMKKTTLENFGLELLSVNLMEPLQSLNILWNSAFIGSRWGNIFIYDFKKNKLNETLLCSVGSSIMALKATKEGPRKILIISSKEEQIQFRDAKSGLLLRTIIVPPNQHIYSILLDGSVLYCGSSKNEIFAYDFTTGAKMNTLPCGNGAVSMKIFKKKFIFVGCYDGFVYVLDKFTGLQIGRFPGAGAMVLALEIIGEKLLTSSKDNAMEIIDIPKYILALIK